MAEIEGQEVSSRPGLQVPGLRGARSRALLPPCIIPRCLFHSRECQGDFSLTDRPPGSMGASPKCRDHYHDQGSQGALQIMMLILKSFACRRSLLWPITSVL